METTRLSRKVACEIMCCVALVAAVAGCQTAPVVFNASDLGRGLVIVLPGIDGQTPYSKAACQALASRCGDIAAIELYDWTSPMGALASQCDQLRNRKQAAALAKRIAHYQAAYPGRPVHLIGHSGGTAIAVWALEDFSSLSKDYDLSAALRHTRKGIVSFCSNRDVMLLDMGTRLVGTMDGRHVVAAGKAGFRQPANCGDTGAYDRLFQVRWNEQAARHGNDGGHFSCMHSRFVAQSVQPLLTAASWRPALVALHERGQQDAGSPQS